VQQNTGTKISVWVTDSFVGFHKWIDAPDEVAFLRNEHRHVFHVKVSVVAAHGDRDVEFFILKRNLSLHCERFAGQSFLYSCEQLASRLGALLQKDRYKVQWIEVSEDGENGARVEYV